MTTSLLFWAELAFGSSSSELDSLLLELLSSFFFWTAVGDFGAGSLALFGATVSSSSELEELLELLFDFLAAGAFV